MKWQTFAIRCGCASMPALMIWLYPKVHMTTIDDNGKLTLGPPTTIPGSLDEVYTLIETGAGNWVFDGDCPPGAPLLVWSMAKKLATYDDHGRGTLTLPAREFGRIIGQPFPDTGTLSITEAELFGLLTALVFAADYNPFCRPPGERVGIWGPVVVELMIRLKKYVVL